MAGILAPMLDIMNRLQSLGVFQHIRVWNSQIDYEREGQLYDFPKPAAFLEVISDPIYEMLGNGVQMADIAFRIHICDEEYDAGQGTFEQNLSVFALRDAICRTAGLALFKPTGCSPLTKVTENQDFEHDNLYHYTVDFLSSFVDSTGAPADPGNGDIIDATVTDIDITANIVADIEGQEPALRQPIDYKYRIPKC